MEKNERQNLIERQGHFTEQDRKCVSEKKKDDLDSL